MLTAKDKYTGQSMSGELISETEVNICILIKKGKKAFVGKQIIFLKSRTEFNNISI